MLQMINNANVYYNHLVAIFVVSAALTSSAADTGLATLSQLSMPVAHSLNAHTLRSFFFLHPA